MKWESEIKLWCLFVVKTDDETEQKGMIDIHYQPYDVIWLLRGSMLLQFCSVFSFDWIYVDVWFNISIFLPTSKVPWIIHIPTFITILRLFETYP